MPARSPSASAREVVHDWTDVDACSRDPFQVALDLDDIADIMYTSGTTGLPKGVLVRHRNVAMMPNCVPHWSGAGWLHGAPLFTFAGMSFIYNPMKLGLAGLYMPKFDVDHWFDVMERDRPAMIFMVPAMAELVTASPRFETSDLSSPFAVSIGSAPLAPATLQRMQDRMPQAAVANSYGLTEAGPAYIVMPRDDLARKPGSVGKATPPMEVKVVDADTETERPRAKSANSSCAFQARGASTTAMTPRRRRRGRVTGGYAPVTSRTSTTKASCTSRAG